MLKRERSRGKEMGGNCWALQKSWACLTFTSTELVLQSLGTQREAPFGGSCKWRMGWDELGHPPPFDILEAAPFASFARVCVCICVLGRGGFLWGGWGNLSKALGGKEAASAESCNFLLSGWSREQRPSLGDLGRIRVSRESLSGC